MKLATLRTRSAQPDAHTVAVVISDDVAVEIAGVADIGALLMNGDWMTLAAAAAGPRHPLEGLDPARWAPVIPAPGKILCAGLNYRNHILEMGRELPEYPTFFAKYPEALIGAWDDIELTELSHATDWEGELAVVIGTQARHLDADAAADAIAGYAVFNDVTMRDYQNRTLQWLQGKTFEHTSPFGPYLVTPDEWAPGPTLTTTVDGVAVQEASTGDLVFDPAALIAYFSNILTLNPGDVIATGTPGGVGHARKPPRYLGEGSVLETAIVGLGGQRNRATRKK